MSDPVGSLYIGEHTAGYHRTREELLPKEQSANTVAIHIEAGFPKGTPHEDIVARMRGELEEALVDLVEWQRERRKQKANRRKA